MVKSKKRTRAGTLVVNENKLLVVSLRDPHTKKDFYFPPGGKIEKGETPTQAALRETLEETGYVVEPIDPHIYSLNYDFFWNGQTHDCVTHFVKCKVVKHLPEKIELEDEFHKIHWIALEKLPALFAYHEKLRDFILGKIRD